MSSTFRISDDATWMPGGSSFIAMARAIGLAIADDEPALARQFIQVAEWQDPYIDISDVSSSAFKAITNAIKAIQTQLVSKEPTEGVYGLFLARIGKIAELKVALLLDPRAEHTSQSTGKIIVNRTHSWETIEWMYDFVIETFINFISAEDVPLFSMLADDWANQHRELDLRELSSKDFVKLQRAIDYLFGQYRDAGVRRLKCSAFLEPFAPKIIDLHDMLKNDHRLENV